MQTDSGSRRALFDSLEPRQFLSVSTMTQLIPSATSLQFGTPLTLTVDVKAATGKKVPTGKVHLYYKSQYTGFVASLNKHGECSFTFGPGQSLNRLTYPYGVRYDAGSGFTSSHSKQVSVTITNTTHLTKVANGIRTKILTAGTGTAIKKGQKATVEYTGFDDTGALVSESSSAPKGTFTFTLLATPEQTVVGFDDGVLGMKVGETRVIIVPSSLGYNNGHVLSFVVKLDSIG
jgi:FKBP-type peptidyl-prolyl cis-trans isomerase FkpA